MTRSKRAHDSRGCAIACPPANYSRICWKAKQGMGFHTEVTEPKHREHRGFSEIFSAHSVLDNLAPGCGFRARCTLCETPLNGPTAISFMNNPGQRRTKAITAVVYTSKLEAEWSAFACNCIPGGINLRRAAATALVLITILTATARSLPTGEPPLEPRPGTGMFLLLSDIHFDPYADTA